MGIAEDLIIIIIVGLISGLAANKLKIPPLIGYIIAGVIIGPYSFGAVLSDVPRIELLAEIGVALLLFSIGLDFSLKELKSVKSIALIGTPIQILILIAYGFTIGHFIQLPMRESVVFGMVISLSSTMVVLKTLMGRGLIGTLSSRVMIGILIIQDLAAIPLMLIIPNLHSMANNIGPLLFTLLKALLILTAIIIIGVRIIPWILKFVAKLNSRELFLITITAIGLGIGYLTHLFGLSLAFGAFVAGMVISESDYSHKALNDIIPLRDIFGLVFFTTVGMLLNPSFVQQNLLMIFVLVLLVILGKFIVFFLMSIVFKYYNILPLALGFGLAQIGEFSFVLARTGLKNNIVSADFFSLMLSVSVITMIISPFLSLLAAPIYSLKKRRFKHEQIQTINIPQGGLEKHIVIEGGGRIGFQVASIFKNIGFPFIIIEQDFRRFENARNAGFPAIYGDAGQETVLHAAKLNSARLIVITSMFLPATREIITTVLGSNPDIKIIARADELSQVDELFKLNIFEIVQPEFEASLEIIRQSLLLLGVPITQIYQFINGIHKQNYANLKIQKINNSILDNIEKVPYLLDLSWFEVTKNSPLSGKSIGGLSIRSRTGASVVGFLRDNDFIPNPDAQSSFREGDLIAIIGLPENKKMFEDMIKSG